MLGAGWGDGDEMIETIGLQKTGAGEGSVSRDFCGIKKGFWFCSLFSSRRGKLATFRVKRKIVSLSSK